MSVTTGVRRLLAACVLVLGLGACGGDDDGGVVADDPDAPVTGAPDPGGPAPDGGARIVTPTPGLDGVVRAALDSAVVLDDGRLEVRFYGGVQECYGVDHVDVAETDTEVTVSVFTGSRPEAAARACIEIAELQAVIVTLDAPLAERVVVDGSSGTPVTVG
jgi:hypothetical protein